MFFGLSFRLPLLRQRRRRNIEGNLGLPFDFVTTPMDGSGSESERDRGNAAEWTTWVSLKCHWAGTSEV
jgi:hypothetical protein